MQHPDWNRIARIGIVGAVVLVFGQAIGFGFVDLDDNKHIIENLALTQGGIGELAQFWLRPFFYLYIPVTYSVWWVLAKISLSPVLFHGVNIALHGMNALLVHRLIEFLLSAQETKGFSKQTPEERTRRRQFAAGVGALLFALHPLQVESVVWVSGLKDVLSSGLALLSAIYYFQNGRAFPAVAFYILALLAKPAVLLWPGVLGLVSVVLLKRSPEEEFKRLWYWMLPALAVVFVTRAEQPLARMLDVPDFWLRPFIASDGLVQYLLRGLVPIGLSPDAGHTPKAALEAPWFWITVWIPPVLGGWLWFRRGPLLAVRRAAIGIFVLTWVPVSGLLPFEFQNFSTVADRYMYLPLFGVALGLGFVVWGMREDRSLAVAGLAALGLGTLAFSQTRIWQSTETLFARTLERNPRSYLAAYGLGRTNDLKGNPAEAYRLYTLALESKPMMLPAQLNAGAQLLKMGRYDDAIAFFGPRLKNAAADRSPFTAQSYSEMRTAYAVALAERGRTEEARAELEEALRLNPGNTQAARNLEILGRGGGAAAKER